MNSKVLIIIVNYKTGELVVDCLNSLKKIINSTVEVIVVDNFSKDTSINLIEAWISEHNHVYLISATENLGFSGANNLAIESAKNNGFIADFVWLLNPDTLVSENALQSLVSFIQKNPQIGIVGSKLMDREGYIQCSAFRFHSIFSELDDGLKLGVLSKLLQKWQIALPITDSPIEVDWVAGASMLIRQHVFDDIGLFDDNYFLYFEETDFCLQAKKAGWACWYVPESRVVHFVGSSTGVTNGSQKRRPRYWFESRRRYFLKNHGWAYLCLANIIWAIAFSLFRIRQKLQNKPDNEAEFLLRDFIQFNFFN
jgi:N-acetylglucosaminyl-diphospho-decaprenol L-rhamnosyltransferase